MIYSILLLDHIFNLMVVFPRVLILTHPNKMAHWIGKLSFVWFSLIPHAHITCSKNILGWSYPNCYLSLLPLQTFGCTTFVHIYSQHGSKLEAWSMKCIFLSYSPNRIGYKCIILQLTNFFISWMSDFLKFNHIIPIMWFKETILISNHKIGTTVLTLL